MDAKKVKNFKIFMAILVAVLLIGITAYICPVLVKLNTAEGQILFKEKINNLGFLGLLWLFGIQVAQIFLAFIPGEPIEVLAGMCYGGLWGTVFIMASIAIIATVIYILVKKLGKKFVYHFCDEKRIIKIENLKIFQNTKKIEKILLILFLVPGTPKDLLTYVAALLPIKPLNFIVIATLARFPSVISSTLAGEYLVVGDWKFSILVYAITFTFVGLILFLMNKFDKTKVTEETLNTLKNENI